jgi:hypothetical protein
MRAPSDGEAGITGGTHLPDPAQMAGHVRGGAQVCAAGGGRAEAGVAARRTRTASVPPKSSGCTSSACPKQLRHSAISTTCDPPLRPATGGASARRRLGGAGTAEISRMAMTILEIKSAHTRRQRGEQERRLFELHAES